LRKLISFKTKTAGFPQPFFVVQLVVII